MDKASDLLRGHTDTVVLSILVNNDNYGYEIKKHIIEKAGGDFELKEATLYSSYKRLEKSGHIKSYWGDETMGGRRRYYSITDMGKKLLEKNKKEWKMTQIILNKLLEV
ncbi:MAG: PadR family transcriptional regulator [Lachnospirales bacterium]